MGLHLIQKTMMKKKKQRSLKNRAAIAPGPLMSLFIAPVPVRFGSIWFDVHMGGLFFHFGLQFSVGGKVGGAIGWPWGPPKRMLIRHLGKPEKKRGGYPLRSSAFRLGQSIWLTSQTFSN